jgi:hypothetical protein
MASLLNFKNYGLDYHGVIILDPGESTIIWTNGFQGLIGVNIVGKTATIDVESAANTDVVHINEYSFTKGESDDWTDASELKEAIDALPGLSATVSSHVVTVTGVEYLVISKEENAGTITITHSPSADYMVSVITDSYETISNDKHTPQDLEDSAIQSDDTYTCVLGASAYKIVNDGDSSNEIKVTWRIIRP